MGVVENPILLGALVVGAILVLTVVIVALKSFHNIGPSEVGLVIKSFGRKLPDGKLIAENGEAGYQPDLLMPGWRAKLWPIFRVEKHPWVQIQPGAIGVVIAQVGGSLPSGAKSAIYNDQLGDFSSLRQFLAGGGQRGVQRYVLPPGTTVPMHPMAFVVITRGKMFGKTLSDDVDALTRQLTAEQLSVTEITPGSRRGSGGRDRGYDDEYGTTSNQGGDVDVIGIVTTLEGPPLPSGDIAGRLGGFDDVKLLEEGDAAPAEVIQLLLGTKNGLHNNYQDFQAFLDNGGCIGLQHDPLLYGSYLLNPFLVKVEIVPMLVVDQGEVAVVKSYVGLPTVDTSGVDYKFGSIVAPGHRGLWSEPLRTGKYPLNPRIYQYERVPTSILTLNWANATSAAHNLDKGLSSIAAKSSDAFTFSVDLQVQIHVPDTHAPRVIGMVGTMQNLVNEVLQSAVGNYIRNSLQKLKALRFIETRDEVQADAEAYVTDYLGRYNVEVRGVYIQDVVFPDDLVKVLTSREIANQEKTTFAAQQAAQLARVDLERQTGIAAAQSDLAKAEVSIEVNKALAAAAIAQADGQAEVTRRLGEAEGAKISAIGAAEASAVRAKGLAEAEAYEAQQNAIGREQTALVAALREIGVNGVKITPDTLVGGGSGSIMDLITLALTNKVTSNKGAVDNGGDAATITPAVTSS